MAVFVGLIPTDLVEPTWDNAQEFVVEKPRAAKKVATSSKAVKFAPKPNKVVEPVLEAVVASVSDPNKDLKDALRRAMYDTFYKQQQEAVADAIYSKKSEIHAAYVEQYDSYKANIKSVISVVTEEFESIKAQVTLDLNAWADQEVKSYEIELSSNFEAHKSILMQEALDEAELPDGVNADTINSLINEAKEAEKATKFAAEIVAKEAVEAAKKLEAERAAKAMDLYNQQQKAKAEAAAKARANKAKQEVAKYLSSAKSFYADVMDFIADGGDINGNYKAHLNSYKQLVDNCQALYDAGKYEEALLASKKFYALFKRELESLIGYMKSIEADKTAANLRAIEGFRKAIKAYKADLLIAQDKRESGMTNHEIMLAIRDLNSEISKFEKGVK